jgi:hypothetical protein
MDNESNEDALKHHAFSSRWKFEGSLTGDPRAGSNHGRSQRLPCIRNMQHALSSTITSPTPTKRQSSLADVVSGMPHGIYESSVQYTFSRHTYGGRRSKELPWLLRAI